MMNTGKKLSVVMPAYNEGEHIFENLKEVSSIISGFMDDYEIIAVNDGSVDNTRQEIKRYVRFGFAAGSD